MSSRGFTESVVEDAALAWLEGYAALRDMLLPKLISGQFRVADPERMVDDCEPNAGVFR